MTSMPALVCVDGYKFRPPSWLHILSRLQIVPLWTGISEARDLIFFTLVNLCWKLGYVCVSVCLSVCFVLRRIEKPSTYWTYWRYFDCICGNWSIYAQVRFSSPMRSSVTRYKLPYCQFLCAYVWHTWKLVRFRNISSYMHTNIIYTSDMVVAHATTTTITTTNLYHVHARTNGWPGAGPHQWEGFYHDRGSCLVCIGEIEVCYTQWGYYE